jgi:hypothetical protein
MLCAPVKRTLNTDYPDPGEADLIVSLKFHRRSRDLGIGPHIRHAKPALKESPRRLAGMRVELYGFSRKSTGSLVPRLPNQTTTGGLVAIEFKSMWFLR